MLTYIVSINMCADGHYANAQVEVEAFTMGDACDRARRMFRESGVKGSIEIRGCRLK